MAQKWHTDMTTAEEKHILNSFILKDIKYYTSRTFHLLPQAGSSARSLEWNYVFRALLQASK